MSNFKQNHKQTDLKETQVRTEVMVYNFSLCSGFFEVFKQEKRQASAAIRVTVMLNIQKKVGILYKLQGV